MNNFENNSPVYLQIAEKLATQIFGGKLAPGAQLPTVREIAIAERVNPNTVQKALAKLEEEGLITTERTNGKFVTGDAALIKNHKAQYAKSLANDYLAQMNTIGFNCDDAISFLKSTDV